MREHEAGSLTKVGVRRHAPFPALACVLLALPLVACTTKDPRPGKHAMVAGHVDLAAEVVPAGTDLRLRLQDPALGGRVLGTSTIQGVESGRVPFVICYDPRQITFDRRYQVEAELVGPGGSRLAAVVPVEVNPRDQPEVQIALGLATDGPAVAGTPGGVPAESDAAAGSEVVVLPAQAAAVPR
jgi:uncharacterized lipoprotein YbaY